MYAAVYVKVLYDGLGEWMDQFRCKNLIFQQDNAAVHTAKTVKNYFATKNIDVLPWPARSPDLNIIENCWGELSRRVFSEGRQFDHVADLKLAISEEWEKLDISVIQNLYDSLPRRMVEVLKNHGGGTHY